MSEMHAIQAVRSGRIPVITSGITPAAIAKQMLPSLAQAWKKFNPPEAGKLVHIATPEDRLGTALMPSHRVARMKRGEALIIRRGMCPYLSTLADVTTSPWFCGEDA